MNSNSINNKFITNIFIYLIFVLAFIERTVFDLGPNVELVTLSLLLGSIYLSKNTALKLTFLLMAATDLIISNTQIFIFTWSGFLIPVLIISLFKNSLKIENLKLKIITPIFLGVTSNLFFYLWSNLGVWILDSWGMYSKDLLGLIHCYIMGLPFLRLHLASTIIFVPLGFMLFRKIEHWSLNNEHRKVYNT